MLTKLILMTLLAMTSVIAMAQDVTQFMGIPVDGPLEEMLRKIRAKGFKPTEYNAEMLEGEFNGNDVNVGVVTNKGKVWRVGVLDKKGVSEGDIKIRFNKLIRQFSKNDKYIVIDAEPIAEDEDISFEMTVHNKRYQASFAQTPDFEQLASLDSAEVLHTPIISFLLETARLADMSLGELLSMEGKAPLELIAKQGRGGEFIDVLRQKSVWFTISEIYGEYSICLFYDNELNAAHGEDL